MISERVLKGQTDKLYFCTSLAPPNVIPSGSLVLLLSPSTTTTQTNMDLPAPDVEGYKGVVVVVSHIQRIGCQPEKNYFTRWPIPLVVC